MARTPAGRPAGVQSRSRPDGPELETLPHADPLFRLLRGIDATDSMPMAR